jgi:methylmalonyl-CoA/ethylmalonyl-CoA epimerase
MQFDHIGVIAFSLEDGRAALSAVLDIPRWTEEYADPVNQIYAQFGADSSGVCYELIVPFGESSPVTKALRSGKNILSHVAYLVSDLTKAGDQLRAAGAVPTSDPKPAVAYGGKQIQFFVTPMRIMIELIEAPAHRHLYEKTY